MKKIPITELDTIIPKLYFAKIEPKIPTSIQKSVSFLIYSTRLVIISRFKHIFLNVYQLKGKEKYRND